MFKTAGVVSPIALFIIPPVSPPPKAPDVPPNKTGPKFSAADEKFKDLKKNVAEL
jgi:hypothetical protein